jgi:hypothetical protein
MNSNQIPSLNPCDDDSLNGVFRHVVGKMLQGVNGMLPAQVIAYQPATTSSGARVQVQPMITVVDTNGNQVTRAQLASIPVYEMGGNGWVIKFPLAVGDLGWIVAADRDISQFLQSYSISPPNTYRVKDFADAVFLPAGMKGYASAVEDAEGITIQNQAGTIKVSLTPAGVIITGAIVTVTGNLVVDGSVSANGIIMTEGADTPNFSGNLFVNGTIAASSSITPFVPP